MTISVHVYAVVIIVIIISVWKNDVIMPTVHTITMMIDVIAGRRRRQAIIITADKYKAAIP